MVLLSLNRRGRNLVVIGSDEMVLRRAHGRAHGERTRDIGDRRGDVGEAGEVVVG